MERNVSYGIVVQCFFLGIFIIDSEAHVGLLPKHRCCHGAEPQENKETRENNETRD